jgi:hypothetical protein
MWFQDGNELHQQWKAVHGTKWTSALGELRQRLGDGRVMDSTQILQSTLSKSGWETNSTLLPMTRCRGSAGCRWPGPGSFWHFFRIILIKQQPHCHMCLEFDFQAKCQLFHSKTPSGFGPGSTAVKAWPFQSLDHLLEQLEQILEFWPPLLSHILSHRLPPAALGGLDCKVPEDLAGTDPPLIRAACPSLWVRSLFKDGPISSLLKTK